MSLILDALNRSRQDVDHVPNLATQHYADSEDAKSGNWRRYLPWCALLAALVVIVWLVLDRGGSSPPLVTIDAVPAAAPLASPEQPADLSLSRPEQPAEMAAAAAAVVAGKSEPASVVASEAPPMAVASAAEEPSVEPDAAVTDLYQKAEQEPLAAQRAMEPVVRTTEQPVVEPEAPAAVTSAENSEEQPIDIEKLVLKARDELENARLEEHEAPFIADLSQQTKDAIPTIFYERHDYSGNTSQSSVVLNGKTIKAGGSATPGLKVDEILPDSVVLNYRGTQFRLRALNSWINL